MNHGDKLFAAPHRSLIPRRGSASARRPVSGRLLRLVATLALAVAPGHASADAVTVWNQTSMDVLKAANVLGNPWTRSMAMVHVAIADAVNTIQDRYTRYVLSGPVAPGASADAAV